MLISRRAFTGGAIGFALGGQLAAPAFAQDCRIAAALAAIRAYGEAHLKHFGLPGITLGVTTPDGLSTVMDFGYADAEARSAITPETLFQVGSISKLMNAAVLHQLVAEQRVRLTDRISDLLPAVPLPPGNAILVQHLLDHVAGIAGDAPIFPDGGLWTAYAPGAHWHYSNTGYQILGMLLEKLGGKPLAPLVEERIFAPLGMRRSRGAITARDRPLYAQGYEAADQLPFALGVPLAPAPWVDITGAHANIASTAEDMNRLLRSLADAVQGRGGLGLSPAAARAFATHSVASDTVGMSYGNGLMHVGSRGRAYLHHTGGVVSFSSSFHIDVASGVAAFASATIGAFAEYRPRALTQFAVDALTDAAAGRARPCLPVSTYRSPTPPLMSEAMPTGGLVRNPVGRAVDDHRKRQVGAASTLGRPDFPNHSSIFSRIQPDVRAQARRRHRRELGSGDLFARGQRSPAASLERGASEARRPLRQRKPLVRAFARRRARRAIVARHRSAAGAHRRQSVAHRR